jgi:hypothetical protein
MLCEAERQAGGKPVTEELLRKITRGMFGLKTGGVA